MQCATKQYFTMDLFYEDFRNQLRFKCPAENNKIQPSAIVHLMVIIFLNIVHKIE